MRITIFARYAIFIAASCLPNRMPFKINTDESRQSSSIHSNDIAIIAHRIEMIGQSIWLAVISNGTKLLCRRRRGNHFNAKINFCRTKCEFCQNKKTHQRARFQFGTLIRTKNSVKRFSFVCKHNRLCHPFVKFN